MYLLYPRVNIIKITWVRSFIVVSVHVVKTNLAMFDSYAECRHAANVGFTKRTTPRCVTSRVTQRGSHVFSSFHTCVTVQLCRAASATAWRVVARSLNGPKQVPTWLQCTSDTSAFSRPSLISNILMGYISNVQIIKSSSDVAGRQAVSGRHRAVAFSISQYRRGGSAARSPPRHPVDPARFVTSSSVA